MTRTPVLVAFVLTTVLAATFAATAGEAEPAPDTHVNIVDHALDPTAKPLPGQNALPEQTFLNTVRQSAPRLTERSDRRLLTTRDTLCQGLFNGLTVDMLVGLLAGDGYSRKEAGVVVVAAAGTCGGSVLADEMAANVA